MSKKLIAVPIGDPAGIGPEIVVKAIAEMLDMANRIIVIGNLEILNLVKIHGKNNIFINLLDDDLSNIKSNCINLVSIENINFDFFQYGKISAMCGQAAFDYINRACQFATANKVTAIVTTSINKEALKAANINYIGHTEILAGLTSSQNPLTMFQVKNLRVFFLSRHKSLIEACKFVTKHNIVNYVKICYVELEKLLGKIDKPLAIAGLNPHCGEHGLFGDEEVNEIIPAVEELTTLGYNVVGPISADSIFHLGLLDNFSAIVSLYHDQGHIATKTFNFEKTISLTLGLPFLRTSVDHGTAFDIAGKNLANPVSLIEAINVAFKYLD